MIYIASDHAGFKLKEKLKKKIDTEDLSLDYVEGDDYPDYAKKLCKRVLKTKGTGILICGTGIGISMAANKIKGIRCALCVDEYSARMSRNHNNANVLALGGRTIGVETAKATVNTFLNEKFEGGRHARRIAKFE